MVPKLDDVSEQTPVSANPSREQLIPPMTKERVEAILAAAKELGEDPLFEDWVLAVEEYRRIHNTIPDEE